MQSVQDPFLRRTLQNLQASFDGDAWHGPSLMKILRNVDHALAQARPFPDTFTIQQHVLHLTAWTREFANRLKGEKAGSPPEGDWPAAAPLDADEWEKLNADLVSAHTAFMQAAALLSPARLDSVMERGGDDASQTSFATMLIGQAEHNAYHAAQIALLKKAAGSAR